MRIIAGKYRGRKLTSPPSLQTRPTSDRLRETLFNILAPGIEGARFLDLCAGSGAVGIEALSRGGSHVTFVDQSRKMCELIKVNIAALGVVESQVNVVNSEVRAFLGSCDRKQPEASLTVGPRPRLDRFDIIFFDPPYATDYEGVLNYIGHHPARFLGEDAVMIVEHYRKKVLAEEIGPLKRYRVVKQGDSALSFYEAT